MSKRRFPPLWHCFSFHIHPQLDIAQRDTERCKNLHKISCWNGVTVVCWLKPTTQPTYRMLPELVWAFYALQCQNGSWLWAFYFLPPFLVSTGDWNATVSFFDNIETEVLPLLHSTLMKMWPTSCLHNTVRKLYKLTYFQSNSPWFGPYLCHSSRKWNRDVKERHGS